MRTLVTVVGVATCLLALSLEARAGDPAKLYSLYGDSAGDHLGEAVGSAGDVNNDGYDDVIAGGSHSARVHSGKDGQTLFTFKGDTTGDGFGESVNGAGDVNKDGYDDLIVGSDPIYGNYARVFSGKDGKTLYTFSATGSERLGASVDGAGDVNNDGYDDVIVGASGDDTNYTDSGAAHVYSGKDGTVLYSFRGTAKYEGLGRSVSGAGDVNDDGHDDVIVGSPGDAKNGGGSGAARVFSGKDGTVLHTFYGDSANDHLGRSVGGDVDVNDDGYPDLIVGAPDDDDNGADSGLARVYSGKDGKTLYTFQGDKAGHWFGFSVSGAGDVDDDGYDDVVVGAGNGALARTFSGKDGTEMYTVRGNKFGWSVSGTGDVNGDGNADVVVGSSRDDTGGTNAGAVFVYGSPTPEGTVTIDAGAEATNDTSVSLSLTWKAGADTVDEMRVRNAGESWGSWVAVAATHSWTLETGEGTKTVEVQYRDTEEVKSVPSSDSIILDQTAPTGTIVIAENVEWVGDVFVDLALSYEDLESSVAEMHFRDGDAWGDWMPVAAAASHTLPVGDGEKSVEVQYKDAAGNVSETAADVVKLDQTPPTCSVVMDEGAGFTRSTTVELSIAADDGEGSGVIEMTLKDRASSFWPDWQDFASTYEWEVVAGDGAKSIDVKVRDLMGHESLVADDSITLDQTKPVVQSLRINAGRPYVLPSEPLEVEVHARDNAGGSGVDNWKASFDGGKSWSALVTLIGEVVQIERPDAEGLLDATVLVLDGVGNPAWATATVYLVESDLPYLGAGAKFAGAVSAARDVDALALDLVKGDRLSVKVKAAKGLDLALDLCRPEGARLFLGRYPSDTKKLRVEAYEVPQTGRYLLIVRQVEEGEADGGTYKLRAKVRQAKANKKHKAEWTGTEIPVDAGEGSTFKASLKGEGLTLDQVTLVGPDGEVAFEGKGKNGKVTIKPVTLDAGSGTYAIRFSAPLTVDCKWSVKLPKIKGTVGE